MDNAYLAKLQKIDLKTVQTFKELPLSERTQKGLQESNFITPTAIQRQCLRPILRGVDVVAQAQTGSGKTLAYTVPLLELLNNWNIRPIHGTVAIVLVPTRELAHQTLRMMNMIARHHSFTLLHVTGDKDKRGRDLEWASVGKANVLISTPGRLIQHLEQNPQCQLDNVRIVVMDETDRLLDSNFGDQIQLILTSLPATRQMLVFSATQIREPERLVALNMTKAVQVSAHFQSGVTPPNLKQHFITVPLQYKVATLWAFLMAHTKRRILVFVSCQKQVRFLYQLFRELRLPMRVFELRGNMILAKRNRALQDFANACGQLNEQKEATVEGKRGMGAVMLGTSVMERGLDFPFVDWVVQFDCPHTKTEYIHRAGRTARLEQTGQSLLFLLPSEIGFLKRLRRTFQLDIERYRLEKTLQVQQRIQMCLLENNSLSDMAASALLGHLQDYIEHEERPPLKRAVPWDKLKEAALGYGLAREPEISEKLLTAYGRAEAATDNSVPLLSNRLDQLVESEEEEVDNDDEEAKQNHNNEPPADNPQEEVTKKTPALEALGQLIANFTDVFKAYQTRPSFSLPDIVTKPVIAKRNNTSAEEMEVENEGSEEDEIWNTAEVEMDKNDDEEGEDNESSASEENVSDAEEKGDDKVQDKDKQIYHLITASYRVRSKKGGKKLMTLSHS